MKKLIIFGADDMAAVAHFFFTNDSDYNVVAFTVDAKYRNSGSFCDLPLCDFEKVEELYPPDEYYMFIALGYSAVNKNREEKYWAAKKKGYILAKYISSKATCWISEKDIGDNAFILEDNTIQPFVKIGNNVVLWSGNHIGHHAEIGNHVFISSHVVLSGRTKVGDNCFIGVNATVNDHVEIASKCVIGSGALITRNTQPGEVYKTTRTQKHEKKSDELQYFKGKNEQKD